MGDIALRVKDLSKQYYIGKRQKFHNTLRDTLADFLVSPFRRVGKSWRGQARGATELDEIFWALRDISFEVKCGEVVGIIGRNGAGKSTLLKILSRITEPTQGYAEIYGRVGSLLEVGTGFHAELSGRENVYLNGAILGMKKAEIARKFDEIVSFAEIEKFIDMQVKHYSSGMYLRLAFAVAAHLEPEILIVDEVLAVGDAQFQKKCLNKMQDVEQQGRTVLFVSHHIPAIIRLCRRTVLLAEGKIIADGLSHKVASTYLNSGCNTKAVREWLDLKTAPGNEVVRLCAVRVRGEDGQITDTMDVRRPITIEMEYEVLEEGYELVPNFECFNEENVSIFSSLDQEPVWRQRPRPVGRYVSTAWIPGNLLADGTLFVTCYITTAHPFTHHCMERDAVAFHVIDPMEGDSALGTWTEHIDGVVRPLLKWNTHYSPNGYHG